MSELMVIPDTEINVVSYIGEPLKLDAMEIASIATLLAAESTRSSCPAGMHCQAIASRTQFGDGVNLARVDTYYVGCDRSECPTVQE